MRPDAIRRLRLRLGLTQAELAAIVGVHALTISKWEGGRLVPPRFQTALLVAVERSSVRSPGLGARVRARLADQGIAAALYAALHPGERERRR